MTKNEHCLEWRDKGHIILQVPLVITVQKGPDCWKNFEMFLKLIFNHLSRDWRTVDCETECYLLNTSILENHISSLLLNIPSIDTRFLLHIFRLAWRQECACFFHLTTQLSVIQRAGKKTATTPSCSPRLWRELNPSIPAMLHSTQLKISHRAMLTRTQKEPSSFCTDYCDQSISDLTSRR